MNEIWKFIPGFEPYEVSNKGAVRRKYVAGRYKTQHCSILSPFINKAGYYFVKLRQDSQYKQYHIARLVLQTFIGLCPKNHEASHINGDPSDNNIENLCWESHKDNMGRSTKVGKSKRINK